ncbi:hypothetical protein [Polaromonas sp. CG_23.6]|uniref:hypothetical protein n=1 Tax=Polaromonas sp. CG_23.6 TaxID=2760709 RepID=UPI002475186D|nr:hypothetical protein [Polaromonas sp. CG_23.6]MDH6186076.1 hypothetical protein [Polaromonas sp. CG_23.6]
MRLDSTPHLLIPFAACSAEAWLPTLQSLAPDSFKRLGQLLQGMKLVQTDTRDAESLSPPHERALARALGLATLDTADGLLPWAASEAVEQLQAGADKAWAWITPCHWAMGHLHATLTDPAQLALREDESRSLLALMQPYFETDGITLHYLAPGRWLAEGELFRGLPTASIDRVLARNVDAWLPDTKSAAPLRRLQNEMQMLLYTHPSNDEREARRQLPVNSFWISGTGDLPAELGAASPAVEKALNNTLGEAQASAPRSLANAVFREDWAGYAQGWAALEAGDMAALLARQQRSESVRLTLCGESSAQTFETHRTGFWRKMSSLFSPLRPLDVLKQL